jgi:predicted Fe-Mo cluster-binding NifX family protein
MKIKVTSSGKEPDSAMDPRFGRTRSFMVVDPEAGAWDARHARADYHTEKGLKEPKRTDIRTVSGS